MAFRGFKFENPITPTGESSNLCFGNSGRACYDFAFACKNHGYFCGIILYHNSLLNIIQKKFLSIKKSTIKLNLLGGFITEFPFLA